MQRSAEFIWTPDQSIATELSFTDIIGRGPVRRDDGENRWFLFRKSFALESAPSSAALDITVDGRYRLYINGKRVGRGPSRCSPAYQRVDRYDLASELLPGDNTIAVLVHVYGIDTAWYETVKDYTQAIFGDGGLYCVLDVSCGETAVRVSSDTSWRCCEAGAWNRETPRSGWGQDFIEDYDARRASSGWMLNDFDDSHWQAAQLLLDERNADDLAKGFGPIRAFPTLIARDIPHLTEVPIAPNKVLGCYRSEPQPGLPIDQRLYLEALHDCPDDAVENVDGLLSDNDEFATVRTSVDGDIAILIAFEQLHAGYPYIEIDAAGDEIIEVAVAETYNGEFAANHAGALKLERRSFLDCAHLFRYTARPGVQRFEKFEWTGVRYLQLVVRNAPAGLKIRQAGLLATHYPVSSEGAYECSDGMLNSLWQIGRHTVMQCSHDAWEDCPGREKRQWVGDGVVRYPIAAAAFGNSVQALDRRFLLQGLESQRSDGLIQMYAPGDHKTNGVIIPDYSLHFILIAHDYLLQTGDLDTLETVLPGLQRVLEWFAHHTGPDGMLVDVPYWHFIEWAAVGRDAAAASINALYCRALSCAAEISSRLGFDRLARRYQDKAETVQAAINNLLWDAERKVYVDSFDPATRQQSTQVSQQANALLLLFDIAPEQRRGPVIEYITDPKRVKLTAVPPVVPDGEPFDVREDVVRCNTFFSHFLYSALAHCGRFNTVLQLMREHYAPMLATGTTTLWESFDPSASLCHAFSATPVYQLSAHSLGVRATEPGFVRFVVAPQFGDLTHAEGLYPTPVGPIAVTWRVLGGTVEIDIDVPPGIAGEFEVPPGHVLQSGDTSLPPGEHRLILSQVTDYE